MSTPMTKEISAAENMDWQQVVLNGGPPCFHLGWDGRFCGRAEGWPGHGARHNFTSLADRLRANENLAAAAALEMAAQHCDKMTTTCTREAAGLTRSDALREAADDIRSLIPDAQNLLAAHDAARIEAEITRLREQSRNAVEEFKRSFSSPAAPMTKFQPLREMAAEWREDADEYLRLAGVAKQRAKLDEEKSYLDMEYDLRGRTDELDAFCDAAEAAIDAEAFSSFDADDHVLVAAWVRRVLIGEKKHNTKSQTERGI